MSNSSKEHSSLPKQLLEIYTSQRTRQQYLYLVKYTQVNVPGNNIWWNKTKDMAAKTLAKTEIKLLHIKRR
jgi:hypothetical protein